MNQQLTFTYRGYTFQLEEVRPNVWHCTPSADCPPEMLIQFQWALELMQRHVELQGKETGEKGTAEGQRSGS